MFRCGSAYQDRPCETETGKVIGNTNAVAPPTSKQATDTDCTQRGVSAQRVMWAREAGKTAESQLESATGPEARRLITDVYRKRGPAESSLESGKGVC